mgnify:CR=1 FL=1
MTMMSNDDSDGDDNDDDDDDDDGWWLITDKNVGLTHRLPPIILDFLSSKQFLF